MSVENLPKAPTAELPIKDWHEKCDPATWLLEEYKLLTNHYFHEDNQYWKTISIFGTFNGALLAFLGSNFVNTEALAKHFIPIVGCLFSVSWFISLVRIREWRNYMERRIKVIEEYLHGIWDENQFQPLDVRIIKDWRQQEGEIRWFNRPYKSLGQIPASLTLLTLPASFLIVWIIIFFLQLR